ncbi:MAG TPA: LysR family transcriptional regulator [Kofleriaceae bacterium]|nr:LysR family transcriptional regulator [Kofleriaceae bacterium]
MLDPITLDQLRTLATVVDEGSFSAAARKLQRVQSAVSTSMANLEDQLTIPLWDRAQRSATLTEAGQAVVSAARRVLAEVDALRKLAAGMTVGLEASVSLCVDAVFPISALVDMCRGFEQEFPSVALRVDVQTMSAVVERVLEGAATVGIASSIAQAPKLERRALAPIRMVPVVSARHPLAGKRGRISSSELGEYVQIVLSERTEAAALPDQAVLSTRTWRVHDMVTKREMLRAGLGWGNLPMHLARADLDKARLVRIRPEAWADDEHTIHLALVYRRDTTLGPAHRWMLDKLAELCAHAVKG